MGLGLGGGEGAKFKSGKLNESLLPSLLRFGMDETCPLEPP
jgi:hypothetical protein